MRCAVNPSVGHPRLDDLQSANVPKKLLIVGAGPAGMEAARTAALRGHEVSVLEQQNHTGGQVAVAARAHHRPHLGRHIAWLEKELKTLGVNIALGRKASAEALVALKPDAIILATGAETIVPRFLEKSSKEVSTDIDLLEGNVCPSAHDHVLVYDREGLIRGGMAALRAAETCATVIFATSLEAPCINLDPIQKPFIMRSFAQRQVKLLVNQTFLSHSDGQVILRDHWSNIERGFSVDQAIIVGYYSARSSLKHELNQLNPNIPIHVIGDCHAPRTMRDAIREAAEIGNSI